jgi:hypothetical protein
LILLSIGITYPVVVLLAIIATANHFILDAVAGAAVCIVAWHSNKILLNLLVVEDYFLWLVRIHKPQEQSLGWEPGKEDDDFEDMREERWSKGLLDV